VRGWKWRLEPATWLAVGVEKMYVGDTSRTLAALAEDSERELAEMGMQFTAAYAIHPKYNLKGKMEQYGWSREDFAAVVVKNSYHGSLNPYAQHRRALTVEEVLTARMIANPLTLPMCAPIGDGGAAAIVCAKDVASRVSRRPTVSIAACVLRSGHLFTSQDRGFSSLTLASRAAYEAAGVGPEDIDIAEVHDAMAPVELLIYEQLGLCGPGEGPRLLRTGETRIGGRRPVNTSGGLTAATTSVPPLGQLPSLGASCGRERASCRLSSARGRRPTRRVRREGASMDDHEYH
jgi:acetyl-CoA acyltransferase